MLSRVAHEGWAERRPGYGWSFSPMLTTPESLEQTYRVRLALEPAALLEPAYCLDPVTAARCRAAELRLLAGAIETDSADVLHERGVRFHEAIVGASGNPFFLRQSGGLTAFAACCRIARWSTESATANNARNTWRSSICCKPKRTRRPRRRFAVTWSIPSRIFRRSGQCLNTNRRTRGSDEQAKRDAALISGSGRRGGRFWVQEPQRDLSAEELVAVVYPTGTNDLPPTKGYHYSNTNYILAGMIAAKATGKSFRDLVHQLVIAPLGLDSTFYESGTYPAPVIERLAHGYFENPACADYQPPDCKESWNLPMVGRDVRAMSLSWTQAAGGAIANARDVNRWMRAVFAGRVVPPKQQAEWLRMISIKTGAPLAEVSAEDPRGFSLGLSRAVLGTAGAHWFYEGVTLGYRTLYVWFAEDDVMITLQTNSQPADGTDRLSDAAVAIYEAVKPPRSSTPPSP